MFENFKLNVTFIAIALAFFCLWIAYKYKNKRESPSKIRSALITGASSGLGKNIALQYAALKYRLVLIAQNQSKLAKIQQRCVAVGARSCQIVSADLTDIADMKKLQGLDNVDVVIMCHAVSMFAKVKDLKEEDNEKLHHLFEVNFWSYVWLTQLLLGVIKKKGKIIVVSSIAGFAGNAERSIYSASKHALHGFFSSLALETKDVQLIISCPSQFMSNFQTRSIVGTSDLRSGIPASLMAKYVLDADFKNSQELLHFPTWISLIRYWTTAVLPFKLARAVLHIIYRKKR